MPFWKVEIKAERFANQVWRLYAITEDVAFVLKVPKNTIQNQFLFEKQLYYQKLQNHVVYLFTETGKIWHAFNLSTMSPMILNT